MKNDYSHVPQETLEKSKNITKKSGKIAVLVYCFIGLIVGIFGIVCICASVIIKDTVFVFLILSVLCIIGAFALFKVAYDDYTLLTTDFRAYQIKVQLRMDEVERQKKESQLREQMEWEKRQENEIKKRQIAIKRDEYMQRGIPCCPSCGSTSIATVNRGYSMLTGFIGSGKAVNVCQSCGHRFEPGR